MSGVWADSGAGVSGSPRHTVLAPPPTAPQAPEQTVPLPETDLINVLLCDHRQALTLFNHFTVAAAQGNTHTMELLAGALAIDLRLHSQAVLDVLCTLLERRYAAEGSQLAGRLQAQLQAVERDVLEMLTFRREQDWRALAQRTNITHQDYAGLVNEVEVRVLPRLAADMRQEELVSAGLLFQQQKQTASLMPQTGAAAFTAAAMVGPQAASVLGAPLLAGQYQPHMHRHHGDGDSGGGGGAHASGGGGAAVQADGGKGQGQDVPAAGQGAAARANHTRQEP